MKKQRTLSDTGLASKKSYRSCDETTAEYAVEFARTGRDLRRVVDDDVTYWTRCFLHDDRPARDLLGELLIVTVPFVAIRTLTDPLRSGVATLVADESSLDLCHARRLRSSCDSEETTITSGDRGSLFGSIGGTESSVIHSQVTTTAVGAGGLTKRWVIACVHCFLLKTHAAGPVSP